MLHRYKQVYRRLVRLPVDPQTFERLRHKVRNTPGTHAKTQKILARLDEFLVDENFDALDAIYDWTYKHPYGLEWGERFVKERTRAFREYWPQVHLVEEVAGPAEAKQYRLQLPQPLSLMAHFGLTPVETGIHPIKTLKFEPDTSLLKEMRRFRAFAAKNQGLLKTSKIPMLEVVYEPRVTGIPTRKQDHQRIFRRHVVLLRQLCLSLRPMGKQDLDHLVEVASTPGSLNSHYFRYMERKYHKEQHEVAPLVRKYLRKRQVVSDEKEIRRHMKGYLQRQFYEEKGVYHMSPLNTIIPDV